MRVLVAGARGLLGAAVVAEFSAHASVEAADRAALDISDPAAVSAYVGALHPDVIVNCAAYNAVDAAEDNAPHALSVNAFGVLALARAARDAGAVLVHYSTDFVFDGELGRPYTEADAPNPRSVYASSKLLGEWFACEAPGAYVLRVESLFGGPGARTGARRGSLGTIVHSIMDFLEVPVFVDRTVSPSYTPDIARATRAIVERRLPSGTYHCVNSGAATWADIAVEAARQLRTAPRLRPLTLESVALRAPRPRFCALSNARLASVGIAMPSWQDALARYLREDVGV
jgi:dTDP-4-dehydrorhamnose reductase